MLAVTDFMVESHTPRSITALHSTVRVASKFSKIGITPVATIDNKLDLKRIFHEFSPFFFNVFMNRQVR